MHCVIVNEKPAYKKYDSEMNIENSSSILFLNKKLIQMVRSIDLYLQYVSKTSYLSKQLPLLELD